MNKPLIALGILAGFLSSGCGREAAPDASKAWIRHSTGHLVSNPAHARRILPDGSLVELPPQRLPARKAEGELRVGVFGGGAAAGGAVAYINLSRALSAILEGAMSNRVATVADAAMPGLSAGEVAALIRQTSDALDLDVVVLYPDPAHCAAGATGAVARLEVTAPMTSWVAAARESGAKVVLCIPGANLADCPPFPSAAGAAAGTDSDPALAAYLRGLELRAQSDLQGAVTALVQAVELDREGIRFPPSSHAGFQALAAPDVVVVDVNTAIGNGLPGLFGAPGREAFDTETGPNLEGWRILGAAVAAAVHQLAAAPPPADTAGGPAFQQRLGHTRILELVSLNRLLQHDSRPEAAGRHQAAARIASRRAAIAAIEQELAKDPAAATMPDRVRERLVRHPDDLRLREILALHYAALNQSDPALRELEEILKLHPGGIEHRVLHCRLLLQTGRNEPALAEAARLVTDSPDWTPAVVLKSQALLAAGKGGEVVALLEPRRKGPRPDATLLSALASGYTAAGKTNDAVAVLGEAIALQPARADLLLSAAELAIQRAKVDEALGWIERARRVAPDAPEVDEMSAVLFGRMNDFPRAIALLRRAQINSPGRPRTQQLLQEALTLQDKAAKALFEQAGELRKKGDEAGAVKLYQQALTLHPTAPALLENLAFLLATTPKDSIRNGPEALRLARQRMAQMGGNPSPEACATLAAALAETGDFPGAVANAERALGIASTLKDFNSTKMQAALEAYRKNTCWRNLP